MKKLTATTCLTITVLLGSAKVSVSKNSIVDETIMYLFLGSHKKNLG
jgi:hypothetical protein